MVCTFLFEAMLIEHCPINFQGKVTTKATCHCELIKLQFFGKYCIEIVFQLPRWGDAVEDCIQSCKYGWAPGLAILRVSSNDFKLFDSIQMSNGLIVLGTHQLLQLRKMVN